MRRTLPAALLFAAGCASLAVSRVEQPGMPCSQATRVAQGALVRMGYTVDKVVPAKPGAPGEVTGHGETGWAPATPQAGKTYAVQVRIDCSDRGSELVARTAEPLTERAGFRWSFANAVADLAQQKTERPRVSHQPSDGVHIVVEPRWGRRAIEELEADLPSSGFSPVWVEIANRTDRTYGFRYEQVKLITQEGEPVEPLPIADVTAKLGTTMQDRLRNEMIEQGDIPPRATIQGFLYFPASAYRRARVVLIDRATDEPEGFSVEY